MIYKKCKVVSNYNKIVQSPVNNIHTTLTTIQGCHKP